MDNLKDTELTLGLPGTAADDDKPSPKSIKRTLAEANELKMSTSECTHEDAAPPAPKAQVVGWPPIRAYRRNNLAIQAKKTDLEAAGGLYVKVRMDGAPYLRKVDLSVYKGYKDLREALDRMFMIFSGEHAVTYEDKDGDWMLAGDVPWEMFVSSCKRLRIMKGCEARGLSISSP